MPEYDITVTWQMHGVCKVEADSLEDAIDIVKDESTSLPDGSYIHGSFEVCHEDLEDEEL